MKWTYACAIVFTLALLRIHHMAASESRSQYFDRIASPHSLRSYIQRRKARHYQPGWHASSWLAEVLGDAVHLHKNLFSLETAALSAAIVPAVLAVRTFDNHIHSYFYDKSCHKNKCQAPQWVTELARVINAPSIAILSIWSFFTKDEEFKLTGRAMLVSVPFLIYVNQALKNFKCDLSLRPWHEDFSREKQASGGFPSGHVSKATYLAVLYGMRFGYKFAIPFSCFAAFTGIAFVASNRHYASQVVAGVGFGAAYALAASKLVDMHLNNNKSLTFDLTVNHNGGPAIALSYKF